MPWRFQLNGYKPRNRETNEKAPKSDQRDSRSEPNFKHVFVPKVPRASRLPWSRSHATKRPSGKLSSTKLKIWSKNDTVNILWKITHIFYTWKRPKFNSNGQISQKKTFIPYIAVAKLEMIRWTGLWRRLSRTPILQPTQ